MRDGAAPHRRTALCRLGAALLGAVVVGRALEGACFSASKLRSPRDLAPTASTAEAWIQAARSVASGAPETPFYLEAAWRGTSNWWLRPPAYLWAMGIGLMARLWRLSVVPPGAKDLDAADSSVSLKKADVSVALDALKKIELPFYATSAEWVDAPVGGVVLRGNFLRGSLEKYDATLATVTRELEGALGPNIFVHLLRAYNPASARPRALAETEVEYELLVSRRMAYDPSWALPLSAAGLALAAYCTSALGSAPWARALGPVLEADAVLPLAALFGLLAVGEVAGGVAARVNGVRLAAPLLIPSPQLGVVGVLSTPLTPAPSRASGLANALAGPLALAAASALLLAYGLGAEGGDLIALHQPVSVAWPLALLPAECDPMVWAGAHGLLMASLALLPHSPNGIAALQCLVGHRAAEEASKVSSYAYPLMGLLALAVYGGGAGWMQLPFWWNLILINFAATEHLPPLEEKSEVPIAGALVGYLSIACACLYVYPWPLYDLF